MIAIPNMEKPKSCWKCRLMDGEANCLVTDEGISYKQEGIHPNCPLIEVDDTVWENESHKLIRMTNEARFNKAMAERRADEGVFSRG